MKYLIYIFALLLCAVGIYAQEMSVHQLLTSEEIKNIEIKELPGIGLCTDLDGDSVMLIDYEDLPIVHIPAKADARQIIVCDSTIYGAVGNAIYADTCSVPTMILDNKEFVLYPATAETFFVCTSDSTWSDLMIVNPKEKLYSNVLSVAEPIYKIVANDEHVLALMRNQVVAIGSGNEIAPLYENVGLNDIELSPYGLFMATHEGLFIAPSLNNERLVSTKSFARIWWINETLYLLDQKGSLWAVENFKLPN